MKIDVFDEPIAHGIGVFVFGMQADEGGFGSGYEEIGGIAGELEVDGWGEEPKEEDGEEDVEEERGADASPGVVAGWGHGCLERWMR